MTVNMATCIKCMGLIYNYINTIAIEPNKTLVYSVIYYYTPKDTIIFKHGLNCP